VSVGLSLGPATAQPAARSSAAPVYNWTGFYVGATLGGAWQDINGVWVTPPPDVHRTDTTRFWGGGHLGYQFMLDRWVLGIEGSYSAPWSKDYATSNSGPDCINISGTADRTCGSRITNVWTVGGKIGHAFGNVMVYGAGGYANGRIEQFVSATSTGVQLSFDSQRHGGWYAGAGIDMLVTRILWSDLIIGVDYRHIELLERFHPGFGGTTGRNFDATVDTIMAKATFKLGGR
jgi:outer membrane immunogenic protein